MISIRNLASSAPPALTFAHSEVNSENIVKATNLDQKVPQNFEKLLFEIEQTKDVERLVKLYLCCQNIFFLNKMSDQPLMTLIHLGAKLTKGRRPEVVAQAAAADRAAQPVFLKILEQHKQNLDKQDLTRIAFMEVRHKDQVVAYMLPTIHRLPKKITAFPAYVDKGIKKCTVIATELAVDRSFHNTAQSVLKEDSQKAFLARPKWTAFEDQNHFQETISKEKAPASKEAASKEAPSSKKALLLKKENGVEAFVAQTYLKQGEKTIAIDDRSFGTGVERFVPKSQPPVTGLTCRQEVEIAEAEMWLLGDLEKMVKKDNKGAKNPDNKITANPENLKTLFDEYTNEYIMRRRNEAMAKNAQALIKQGQIPLIAVGAAHYAGDNGICALMTKAGFTIERLH